MNTFDEQDVIIQVKRDRHKLVRVATYTTLTTI